ncbi:hypothetical protein E3J38_01880 [candidate division TA06 bacterium]|uniref:Uncharacterized protein n=1 Tax=candidate division TA06 bacterium TaxID=2250710 RepID=A0A523XTI1_UNCT6|nr:MAG: hypothetical protein E3J38_01880 [candidate division TA06 bacterium]
MTKLIRIKITHIHEEDAFSMDKDKWIGKTGMFESCLSAYYRGYYCGTFYPDSEKQGYYFLAIRYRKIRAKKKGSE